MAFFRHRSASRIFIAQPGRNLRPVVIHKDDYQPCGGEKRAGLQPPPALSFKGVHHPCWGGGRAELGHCLPHGLATRFFLQHSGEKGVHQPYGGGELPPAAWSGCGCPSSTRATIVPRAGLPRPGPPCAAGFPGGSHNTPYAARAVLVFWDGPVLVLVARTGVRTCRCTLGRPPLVGAVLVGRWPLSSVLRWWSP